jgi:hypothetical protein
VEESGTVERIIIPPARGVAVRLVPRPVGLPEVEEDADAPEADALEARGMTDSREEERLQRIGRVRPSDGPLASPPLPLLPLATSRIPTPTSPTPPLDPGPEKEADSGLVVLAAGGTERPSLSRVRARPLRRRRPATPGPTRTRTSSSSSPRPVGLPEV